MATQSRGLAVVTGASSGIGLSLARCCAQQGYSLVLAADEPEIQDVANELRRAGTATEAVQVDLATLQGVDKLLDLVRGRPIEALLPTQGGDWAGPFWIRTSPR